MNKKVSKRSGIDYISKSDWVWLPHAAHFCGANECNFKMATIVGDFIVSTIGEYYPLHMILSGINKMQEIGANRLYETMVFIKKIMPKGAHCDCCKFTIHPSEVDFIDYSNGSDAMNGHMNSCYKYSMLKIV